MTRLLAVDALWFGLIVSVVGGIVAPVMIARGKRLGQWVTIAQAAVYANFAVVTVATLAMMWALARHDFSISYVAQVGSRATPLFYTIISLWGALEGRFSSGPGCLPCTAPLSSTQTATGLACSCRMRRPCCS